MLLPQCLFECQDSRRAQRLGVPAVTCHYWGRIHGWSFKPAHLIRPLMELTSKGTSRWLGFHKDGEQKSYRLPLPPPRPQLWGVSRLWVSNCTELAALHPLFHPLPKGVCPHPRGARWSPTTPSPHPTSRSHKSCLVICLGSDSPACFFLNFPSITWTFAPIKMRALQIIIASVCWMLAMCGEFASKCLTTGSLRKKKSPHI